MSLGPRDTTERDSKTNWGDPRVGRLKQGIKRLYVAGVAFCAAQMPTRYWIPNSRREKCTDQTHSSDRRPVVWNCRLHIIRVWRIEICETGEELVHLLFYVRI